MNKYLVSFLLFIAIMLLSVYGGRSFSPNFSVSLPLIFVVLIFPYFSYLYTFSLSFFLAFILDMLAGGGAAHFVAFSLILFLGIIILHFLERSNFISQTILGGIMISLYYITLFLVSYFSKGINLGLILFLDFLGTISLYLLVSLVKLYFFSSSHAFSRLH